MKAIILSIGDELILGQTVDTNSAWLSAQLVVVGCEVVEHVTVGDDQKQIERAIARASHRCDVLLVSGGIGPTPDDLTRQALAAVMRVELELNENWLERIREFFKARNREMPETNKIQAMIPQGATIIENTCGTAAGIDAILYPRLASIGQSAEPQSGLPPPSQLHGRPLGRVLTKMGRVTREQVIEALTHQKQKGGRIGEILIALGYASVADVAVALVAQRGPERQSGPRASDEYMERLFGDEYTKRLFGERSLGTLTERRQALGATMRDALEELEKYLETEPRATRAVVMPGVPLEMKAMFTRDVLPWIRDQSGGGVILSRTLHTFGLGESAVAEMLGDLMNRDRNPSVGTTVANGIVSLRINARFPSRESAQAELEKIVSRCRARLGDLIFGEDDQTLQQVVVGMLTRSKQTVTTAESCTGGLLAKMITDVPGSSAIFKTGFITYSNQSKYERLGVSEQIINSYGAVSEPVVDAMARNARRLANADFALSISGIAGPDGGTPAKPVGMVCIGLAHPDPQSSAPSTQCSVVTRTFNLPGDRDWIRDRSAKMALTMLRYHLLGKPLPF